MTTAAGRRFARSVCAPRASSSTRRNRAAPARGARRRATGGGRRAFGRAAQLSTSRRVDPIPDGVDVVVTALRPASTMRSCRRDRRRCSVASSEEEHDALDQLRVLDRNARSAGIAVGVGCGLAPGLRRRAGAARGVDVRFRRRDQGRRTGWAGPASVNTVRHERRVPVRTWHDGTWREDIRTPTASSGSRSPSAPATVERSRVARRCSSTRSPTSPASACNSVNRRSAPGSAAGSATMANGAARGSRCGVAGGHVRMHRVRRGRTYGRRAGAVLAVVAARLGGALAPRLVQPACTVSARSYDPVPFLRNWRNAESGPRHSRAWPSPERARTVTRLPRLRPGGSLVRTGPLNHLPRFCLLRGRIVPIEKYRVGGLRGRFRTVRRCGRGHVEDCGR